MHRAEFGQYSVRLREELDWYSLNWVELNVPLILTELNDIECNCDILIFFSWGIDCVFDYFYTSYCDILVSVTVYSGRNLLSFQMSLQRWTFKAVKPQNLYGFSVRLFENCLNSLIYSNLCSPIHRILPIDCSCCTRNDSKTKFVVYLTVTISQIYWRKYRKSQKPPWWPVYDTRLKNRFPRVCIRDANSHAMKLGVIWDGMEITTITETLRCSSQLSFVTIRRWIILWHHRFHRTAS